MEDFFRDPLLGLRLVHAPQLDPPRPERWQFKGYVNLTRKARNEARAEEAANRLYRMGDVLFGSRLAIERVRAKFRDFYSRGGADST